MLEKLFKMFAKEDDVLVFPKVVVFEHVQGRQRFGKAVCNYIQRKTHDRIRSGEVVHASTADHTYRHARVRRADKHTSRLRSEWQQVIPVEKKHLIRTSGVSEGPRLQPQRRHHVPCQCDRINVGHVEHLSNITQVAFADVDASCEESFCATISIWMPR